MRPIQPQKGFASLVVILLITSASVIVGTGVAQIAFVTQKNLQTSINSLRSYYTAEAGIEDATYRIKNGISYSPSYVFSVASSTATIMVTSNGDQRIILAQGNEKNARKDVQTTLQLSISDVSFNFGVQVGEGGLTMGNNSTIIGNVYSNGNIVGGGKTNSTITGTAQAASSSLIKNITINGDAYADSLSNCAIGGTAYYVTTFGGDCTASSTQILSKPVPKQGFPITQTQINEWKAKAEAGGILSNYTLSGSDFLGPKKINGDMTLNNNATLTLRGAIWVTGAIDFGNSVTIKLDSSYGTASEVFLADGIIDTGNTTIFQGSGHPSSYVLATSLYGSGDAIKLGNNATGAIFYAPNGIIDVGNNLNLKEATGYGLDVGNNASITYESGLANINFSSGPGGSFQILDWKEK